MTYLLALVAALAAFAQPIPRPEYPQPQFQREIWLNLNGQWELEFDDANTGLGENWASGTRKFTRNILVPFCFESQRSGIGDTSFHPWVWYRRQVTLPADWKGRRTLLHFGAVDYRAMVWVNGRLAGQHEGGHVPFSFDITELLTPAPNTITLRVEDPPTDRTIPRGKQYWEPKSRGIFYTRTTGIWQTVWLEAVGDSYLQKVRISPSITGSVRFQARISRMKPGQELHAEVTFRERPVVSGSTKVAAPATGLSLEITGPRLWNVRDSNLYDVTFELRESGRVLDRVKSYFGFRSVAVESGQVLINGRPTYLKMILDQGYWPESTLTPPSDEAIQFDIKASMDLGFNGARKHQKVEDPRFLYWADKLGYLVSGEMANAYLYDEDYAARFTREWIEAVERDYNHPSIIMWIPINESWGVHNLREPAQQAHLRSLYHLTRSLDPSRIVIENDGWEHVDAYDLFGIHDYARTGDKLLEKYQGAVKPGAPFPPNGRAALVAGYQYSGAPVFLSEFGGIAYVPKDAKLVPEGAWGYSGVEPTAEAALERLRGLYGAIQKLRWAGICYTQLTDVEQEVNGMLTYDRKMKFDPALVRQINAMVP